MTTPPPTGSAGVPGTDDGLGETCTHIGEGQGCRRLGRFELWVPGERVPSRLSCERHLADHIDTMHEFTDSVRVTGARYVSTATDPRAVRAGAGDDAPGGADGRDG